MSPKIFSTKPGPLLITSVARNTVSTTVPRSMPEIHQVARGFLGVSSARKTRLRWSSVNPKYDAGRNSPQITLVGTATQGAMSDQKMAPSTPIAGRRMNTL